MIDQTPYSEETPISRACHAFATTPGRLYVRLAPGPDHAFTVYDGTRLAHETAGGALVLTVADGEVFNLGAVFEVLGQIRAPTSVAVDGEIWAPVLDRAALDDDGEGVFYDAVQGRLWVAVGPGGHRVEIR